MAERPPQQRAVPPRADAIGQESLRVVVESNFDGMIVIDHDGIIVFANPAAERLLGRSSRQLLGMRFGFPHAVGEASEIELVAAGAVRVVEMRVVDIQWEGIPAFLASLRDVTDRKRAEIDAAHFAAVVESSHDAIIGLDLEGTVTSWNRGAERLYGYTKAEMLGHSVSVLAPPGRETALPELLRRARSGEGLDEYETAAARKDGTQVLVSLTASPIYGPDGTVIGASTIARDITDRVHHREELRFLAEHDPLTGARNRRRFEQDLTEQVGRAHRYGERAALVLIDIDGLKQINDTHGHLAGDRAVKQVASAIMARLRDTDMIARIGGDEFAVLLPYAGEAQTSAVAGDLRRAIAGSSVTLGDGTTVSLSASVGAALIDRDTANDEDVLAAADQAMYEDKRTRSG